MGRPRKGPGYRQVAGFRHEGRLRNLRRGEWTAYFKKWDTAATDRILSSLAQLEVSEKEIREWRAELAAERAEKEQDES